MVGVFMGYAEVTTDIAVAAAILAEGRVVAFPTGTAYGLAVDALQGHALQRLRNLKRRPQEKSFTVCLAEQVWDTFLVLTESERRVLQTLQSEALTLLVRPHTRLAHVARDGWVGVRSVDHPTMQALVEAAQVPLTATSANISDTPPCSTVACILGAFPGKRDETTYDLSLGCVLDGGELPVRQPSTIARLEDGRAIIIRSGELTAARIEAAARGESA